MQIMRTIRKQRTHNEPHTIALGFPVGVPHDGGPDRVPHYGQPLDGPNRRALYLPHRGPDPVP
jgi:hypothetical protein